MDLKSMFDHQEITFDALYKKYYDAIFRYCLHKLYADSDKSFAEDIANEAFTKLLIKWHDFKKHTPPILLSWLYKTSDNLIRNYIKKKKREPKFVSYEEYISELENSPEQNSYYEKFTNEETSQQEYINQIKELLTEKEWLLFEQIVIQKHSIAEAAVRLKAKENTVKVSWYRLKIKLKEISNQLFEKNF